LTAAQRCKTKVVPGGVTSVQCTVEVHGSGTAQVFTLDGKSPVLTFGHETEFEPAGSQNRVTLAKKPGVCSLHAQITFYDSAFWYTHIDGESSRLNPVLGGGEEEKDGGEGADEKSGDTPPPPPKDGEPIGSGAYSAVRLHDDDDIAIGAPGKKCNIVRFKTDYESRYWIEYDLFMNGGGPTLFTMSRETSAKTSKPPPPKPPPPKSTRQMLTASLFTGSFKLKREAAEAEMRRLEAEAAARKLAEQKARVLALRKKMQGRTMEIVGANQAQKMLEDMRAEKARLLAMEEARRVAEAKSKLARERMMHAKGMVVQENRVASSLEVLREAQREKARQEAAEARRIEEARKAEEDRLNKAIADREARIQAAIDSGNYKKITAVLEEGAAQEDGVKVATRAKMAEAKAKLEKVAANLSTKELQELQKDRIDACAARIAKLQDDPKDHAQLVRELAAIDADRVLKTAPQLQEEVTKAKKIVKERTEELDKLVAALEEALESDDTDVSKKLKLVKAAKAALDAHHPSLATLDVDKFEVLEVRTGQIVRRLAMLEKLRKLVAKLNNRTIAELKSYRNPDEDVVSTMKAAFSILGNERGEMEDWSALKKLIGKTGKLGLKRRINQFTMDALTKEHADYSLEELLLIKDVDSISTKSKGAAIFYAWCKGILDQFKDEQEIAEMKKAQKTKKLGRSKTSVAL
jgi:hypothetical protein